MSGIRPILASFCLLGVTSITQGQQPALEEPVVEGRWLRPAATTAPAVPEWGHAEGLRVGIAPLPGRRGLLRIYTPYLGQAEPVMLNFIAVEPIPRGEQGRGYSELRSSSE